MKTFWSLIQITVYHSAIVFLNVLTYTPIDICERGKIFERRKNFLISQWPSPMSFYQATKLYRSWNDGPYKIKSSPNERIGMFRKMKKKIEHSMSHSAEDISSSPLKSKSVAQSQECYLPFPSIVFLLLWHVAFYDI